MDGYRSDWEYKRLDQVGRDAAWEIEYPERTDRRIDALRPLGVRPGTMAAEQFVRSLAAGPSLAQ
jgi:hypothetical protein